MAEFGLFPEAGFFHRDPRSSYFAEKTLNYFRKREYRVRLIRASDVPELVAIEELWWVSGVGAPTDILKKRLELFPAGQLALELEGKVVGAIYSQRIGQVDIRDVSMLDVHHLYEEKG